MSEYPSQNHNPYGRSNVRRGILHYLSGRTLAGISSVGSVILLARYMRIIDYAGYTALTGLLMTATLICDLGINRTIARYVPEGRVRHSPEALVQFVWRTAFARVITATVFSTLIYFGWPIILHLFAAVQIPHFPWALVAYLLATVLFHHFTSVMQALVLQKVLARLTAIQWGGRLLLILWFIWKNGIISLDQALWVMALPELVIALAFVWFIRRYMRSIPRKTSHYDVRDAWPNWHKVISMSRHNYMYNLLGMAPQGYFMRMVVAALLPAPFVAAYGFFASLIERARKYLPFQLMRNFIEPVVIASYLKDHDFARLRQRTQLLYKVNLLILGPALVTVTLYGDGISHLLIGSRFDPYTWLIGLFIAQLVIANYMLTTQLVLNAVEESDILTKTGVLSISIALLSAAAVAKAGSLREIILAPLAYDFANSFFGVYLIRRRGYNYRLPWTFLLKLTSVTLMAVSASLLIRQAVPLPAGLLTTITAFVAILTFLFGYLRLNILDTPDRQALLGIIRRSPPLETTVRS